MTKPCDLRELVAEREAGKSGEDAFTTVYDLKS